MGFRIVPAGNNLLKSTIVDAKGDLLVATSDDTINRLPVGSAGQALVANSATTTGLVWQTVGDVTLVGTETLTNKTLTAPVINNAVLQGAEESWNVAATAATGTLNLSSSTSTAFYYTSNATNNFTLSFWGTYSSTYLESLVEVGDSITFAVAVTNGATPYYATAIYVDNYSVPTKWQGGSAPTSGNANSIDVYVVTLIKTADNGFPLRDDWVALASQTQFA